MGHFLCWAGPMNTTLLAYRTDTRPTKGQLTGHNQISKKEGNTESDHARRQRIQPREVAAAAPQVCSQPDLASEKAWRRRSRLAWRRLSVGAGDMVAAMLTHQRYNVREKVLAVVGVEEVGRWCWM